MKKFLFILIIFLFSIGTVFSQESTPERPVDLSLELNMMLHFQLDVEYFFNESLGIKGGIGLSPIGITCISYNVLAVYHLNLPMKHFQLDLEAGLPLAYFDFIEGRYVDWDPMIDDPYFGFLPGFCAVAYYRFNQEQALGLRAGASVMLEHQLNTSWKGPEMMPMFALVYNF